MDGTTGLDAIPICLREVVLVVEPARDAVTLEDLLFTIYHQLGIDADKELVAFGTRPIEIIKDGKLVQGLI
jgi:hypothetical protein